MIIQHNISALNSHRNLMINNGGTAKNLEKLSSGFRINRAGDDAAGLAISEKMRGQIRGLAMAEQNTANGISMIQTAEGGLNETHAILQRMRELAVQSANGTYQDDDRKQIALEVNALKSEIDRIATSTHYNGIKLLDGSMGGVKYTATNEILGAAGAATGDLTVAAQGTFNINDILNKEATLVIKGVGATGTVALQVGDKTYEGTFTTASTVMTFKDASNTTIFTLTFDDDVTKTGVINGLTWTADATAADLSNAMVADASSQVVFQIGANGGADQRVGLHVNNMSTGNLGTHVADTAGVNKHGTIAGLSIATQAEANKAIKVIDAATNQVSATRANLGALQNRLEHTINNLGVTKENLTAAESTIRDVDMAKEMMEFTKNNILVQASQAMLAQANQLPQGVLSLLR